MRAKPALPPAVRVPLAETTVNTSPKKAPVSRKRKPDTQDTPTPATLPELQDRPLKGPKATPPAKKAKMAESGGVFDVQGIVLEDEEYGEVEIYDTCDEIRKKLRAYLRKEEVTQAALLQALAGSFHDGRKLSAAQLKRFMDKKGPMAGNTSGVFYAGYVFFEKRRMKEGKAKTQMRLEMEEEWGMADPYSGRAGVDTTRDSSRPVICHVDSTPVLDKYGRMHSVRTGSLF